MFTSLGYVTELERAAERGKSDIQSKVDIGQRDIREAAKRAFPGADSITVHGDGIAGAGGVTYTFTVPDDRSKYVLKFAPEEAADHLKKGAEIYRYLDTQTEVPVPAVQTVESAGNEHPYPYTIVEHVEGDELSSIDQFRSFPRERKKAMIRGMGRVLGKLHEGTQFERYGSLSVQSPRELEVEDSVSNWRDYYLTTYEEYVDAAEGSPVTDLAVRAYEVFKREANELRPETDPVLLHADFTPDNLITEDGSVRAVLDWELAKSGCSAKEFWEVEENVVHIFQTDEVRRDLRNSLYEGYGEVRATSKTFLGMKSLFAVGEFTKIGNVHSVLSDVKDDLDTAEFRTRAEKELESRIHTAETRLEQLA